MDDGALKTSGDGYGILFGGRSYAESNLNGRLRRARRRRRRGGGGHGGEGRVEMDEVVDWRTVQDAA